MTPKQKVLKRYPKACTTHIVWPRELWFVDPYFAAPDSISWGFPTAREAWADAAKRMNRLGAAQLERVFVDAGLRSATME